MSKKSKNVKTWYVSDYEGYIKYRQIINDAILKYDIDRILEISKGDDAVLTSITDCIFVYLLGRRHNCTNRFIYIIQFFLGLLIFKIKYCPFSNKKIRSNVLLVETADKYNQMSVVCEYIPDSEILIMPSFKFDVVDGTIELLNKCECPYSFLPYTYFDILSFLIKSVSCYKTFNMFVIALKDILNCAGNENKIYDLLLKSIFYNIVFSKGHLSKKIFFWKHDMLADSLAMKIMNKKCNLKNISVSVNHGAFIGFNLAYVRSFSDYQFCISEREKMEILKYGSIPADRVFPIGATFQLFSEENIKQSENSSSQGDILVLLTSTNTDEYLNEQIDVLSRLNDLGAKYTVRFRPSSKEEDMRRLNYILQKNNVRISNGGPLINDLVSYRNIISFSYDALPLCFIIQRRVMLYLDVLSRESIKKYITDSICVTSDVSDVDIFIQSTARYFNYSEDDWNYLIYNFGYPEINYVKDNLLKALSFINDDIAASN